MTTEIANVEPLDFHQELHALIAAAPSWPMEIGAALEHAFGGGGGWLWGLVLMVAAGALGERLACWKLNSFNQTISEQQSDRWSVAFGYALLRVVFDLLGVALFGLFAWIALHVSVDRAEPVYATLGGVLIAILTLRSCIVLSRAVLAPHSEGIRPITLSTEDARAFHRWVVAFIAAYVFIVFMGENIFAGGMTPVLARATEVANGLALVLFLNVFVWANRERLARLFAADGPPDEAPSALQQVFSQSWPFIAAAWLLLLWVNWAHAIFTNDVGREQSMQVSWWITLLFPVVDRLVHALLTKVTDLPFFSGTGFAPRRERFVTLVQRCVRIILVAVALAALAVTWNFAGANMLQSAGGQRVIWGAVDIGITMLVAYILYEMVMSVLDRHMPEEPEADGEIEGEVGGAGATRQQTLAPLLRGVFVVVLMIVVVLSVMNSLGVQILPLIAGASIVGLAIGFGSQKLVQDIISGVFFLIDDAFRRGEYIDLGNVKGTVEKISIRSMQLRHHMGALHTIPFGEIRHLTNYSRDWVMMKLKLRLTYDTDVERVRKLIKKLGQELLEDEELGPKFLQPLKSQGVYSMEDDSAMIIRVKFMTRPGDQFEVRKTVFARIRDLFEREGIQFAHRVVSVRLDGTEAESLGEEEKKQVAGAVLATRAEETTKAG